MSGVALLAGAVGTGLVVSAAWARRSGAVFAMLALAGVALAGSLVLSTPERYYPRGHERVWVEMSHGVRSAGEGVDEFAVPAMARGVAHVLARTPESWRDDTSAHAYLGNTLVSWTWIAGNRVGFFVWLLALALIGTELGGARIGLLSLLAGLLQPAALSWSTTLYGVLPALALGAIGILAGLRGRRGAALLLSVAALATRPEVAPLALAAVLLPGRRLVKDASDGVLGAVGGLAAGMLFVTGQDGGVGRGLGATLEVAFANVRSLGLGVPTTGWIAGASALCLIAWAALPGREEVPQPLRWRVRVLFAAVVLAAGSLVLPTDLGARHFLPLATLVTLACAASAAPAWRRGTAPRLLVATWLAATAVGGGAGLLQLDSRFDRGAMGALPAWHVAAERGPTRSAEEWAGSGCVAAFPSPTSVVSARSASDPTDLLRLRKAQREGACVVLAAGPEEMTFNSDTRSERFDRAVLLLGLEPVGWVSPTTDGAEKWMLWRSIE